MNETFKQNFSTFVYSYQSVLMYVYDWSYSTTEMYMFVPVDILLYMHIPTLVPSDW